MDDLERLVDELCCGNHSLGDVYRYLLRVSGDDEAKQDASSEDFFRVSCRNGCSTTPVAP